MRYSGDLDSFFSLSFFFNPCVILSNGCDSQIEQAKRAQDDRHQIIYVRHQRIDFSAFFHP